MSTADSIALSTCIATWSYVFLMAVYIGFVAVTLGYIHRQFKHQEKEHKLQTTFTTFKELQTKEGRDARRNVYKQVPTEIAGIEDEKLEKYLDLVQEAVLPYYRIGYLIHEGHIDAEPIVTTHWESVWRCWKKTENLIKWARTKRNESIYLDHFKYFFDLSEAYRIQNRLEEPKFY